jgi:sulfur carrier protein ThiS
MPDQEFTIRVTGVGNGDTVTVSEGTSVADALRLAGIDPESQGVDVRLNAEPVANPTEAVLSAGSSITLVPKKPALG